MDHNIEGDTSFSQRAKTVEQFKHRVGNVLALLESFDQVMDECPELSVTLIIFLSDYSEQLTSAINDTLEHLPVIVHQIPDQESGHPLIHQAIPAEILEEVKSQAFTNVLVNYALTFLNLFYPQSPSQQRGLIVYPSFVEGQFYCLVTDSHLAESVGDQATAIGNLEDAADFLAMIRESFAHVIAFSNPDRVFPAPIYEELVYQVLLEEFSVAKVESRDFYDRFFTPLVLMCYQLLSELIMRMHLQDLNVDLATGERITFLENLLLANINTQAMHARKHPDPQAYEIILPNELEVTPEVVKAINLWIDQLLNRDNWYLKDGIPFYVYLEDTFAALPKILIKDRNGQSSFIHEFTGSLVMPRPFSDEETSEMWNQLAAEYDEDASAEAKKVAWEFKKVLYSLLIKECQLQAGNTHVELCCGPGNIVEQIPEGVTVYGFDIAEEMVKRATTRGMQAQEVNLNQEKIPLDDASVDSVNISFGEMWLDMSHVSAETYRILKPGGRFIFNLYNVSSEYIESIEKILSQAGFAVELKHEEIILKSGEVDLVEGKKTSKQVVIVVATKLE